MLRTEIVLVHTSRDKILLEGEESGDEGDGDEDEVFGLKGLSDEDSDDQVEDQGDSDMEEEPPKIKSKISKGKKLTLKDSSESSDSESEEETWGRNKSAYYSSNAAQLESDDEEANELEEQEAKRLQAKARDIMDEDDFGLDDTLEDMVGQAAVKSVLCQYRSRCVLGLIIFAVTSRSQPRRFRSLCRKINSLLSDTLKKRALRVLHWLVTGMTLLGL